jgi:hypothetical protein
MWYNIRKVERFRQNKLKFIKPRCFFAIGFSSNISKLKRTYLLIVIELGAFVVKKIEIADY